MKIFTISIATAISLMTAGTAFSGEMHDLDLLARIDAEVNSVPSEQFHQNAGPGHVMVDDIADLRDYESGQPGFEPQRQRVDIAAFSIGERIDMTDRSAHAALGVINAIDSE